MMGAMCFVYVISVSASAAAAAGVASKPTTPAQTAAVSSIDFVIVFPLGPRYRSVGSRPSRGAPVPDEPMNSLRPSPNVMSRPFALFEPSFA